MLLILFGALIFGGVSSVQAQNGGVTFTTGPNLATARMMHAVTVLADGRAALFGGHGTDFVPLQSAEIWDPATNSFTTHQMHFTHDTCAIARLNDGRYLLAGGFSDPLGVGYTTTAEVFDPTSANFTPTGAMHYARAEAAAATLTGGQVLVVGSWYEPTAGLYGDLYDPAANTFTATKQLNTGRSHPRVLPTADGKAVVCGGMDVYGGSTIEQVELYDPALNSFSILQANLLPGEPGWVTGGSVDWNNGIAIEAQKLPDGRYLFLASNINTSTYSLFTFDPATKSFAKFATAPALPSSGVGLLTPVVDAGRNKAYLLAFVTPYPSMPVQARVYTANLTSGALSAPTGATPLNGYLGNVGLNLLVDGRLFVTGGNTAFGPSNYNFSPAKLTFFGSLASKSAISAMMMLID